MARFTERGEWIYDVVIELQERYDILILASAVPQEERTNATS
ncbi:MAG TPA: hypothetical protein VGX03_04655 [Candidatus Binatia bacterium]|nr:hypothetical protein [Candidatus Binatia bacterium]